MDLQKNAEKLSKFQQQTPSKAKTIIMSLFDEGTFEELDAFCVSDNVITGFGTVAGKPVYAFVQNSDVQFGAICAAAISKIKKIYDLALKTGAPVVGFYDSSGAKLDDGFSALAHYGDWMAAVNQLSGVVPQISIILGACIASAAMIACSADLVIMEKGAQLYFDASGMDQSKDLLNVQKSGLVHMIADGAEQAIRQARQVLSYLPTNNLSEVGAMNFSAPSEQVAENLTGLNLIQAVCDESSAIELQKQYGCCVSIALATISGTVVGMIAACESSLCENGAKKAARFVRFCDSFNIPVVTFISVKQFCNKVQTNYVPIKNVALLAHAYAEATTIKISVVTGQACGSVYMAMAGKGSASDYSLAWVNASISPLPVETLVEMFWHDRLSGAEDLSQKRAELAEEYKLSEADCFQAAKRGCVDQVISPQSTRSALISGLTMLAGKRVSRLPKKHGNMLF